MAENNETEHTEDGYPLGYRSPFDGELEEEVIAGIVGGERIFECKAQAKIKVGRKVKIIPIRSIDMTEVVKTLSHKRPKPPVTRRMIRADSPEGREAGLKRDKWVEVEQEADEGYQEKLRQYNTELGYLIVLRGLDITVAMPDGEIVWDPNDEATQKSERAIAQLETTGLTSWQFQQINDAVQNLTRFADQELEKNYEGA
tara:strand:+ start:2937 stop:3536 length:600 start_codon:yes stop_codon:yes gene_type:complete